MLMQKKLLLDMQDGKFGVSRKIYNFAPVNFQFLNLHDLHIGFFSHVSGRNELLITINSHT